MDLRQKFYFSPARKNAVFLCFFFLVVQFVFPQLLSGNPEWSVIFYLGTDEKDLGEHTEPVLNAFLKSSFPEGIEVLLEYDSYLASGSFREIREGNKILFRSHLPEVDSADPETFRNFLSWANASTRGRKKMLVLVTHSWGWRGIIQDYTIPGKPEMNSVLSMREFSRLVRESGLGVDVLFLDCCVCGNVEVLEELRGTAPFLVASQKDTPYCGLPYLDLLEFLAKNDPSPRDAAGFIPLQYIKAFARDGTKSEEEGSYDLVTAVAIDMKRWEEFSRKFRSLVQTLNIFGFRDRLKRDPGLFQNITDGDGNMDLVEFLIRFPKLFPGEKIGRIAGNLLLEIGYPVETTGNLNEPFFLDPGQTSSFCLQIQGDQICERARATKNLEERWKDVNQDLSLPDDLSLKVLEGNSPERPFRVLEVRGFVRRPLYFRPWLPGTRSFQIFTVAPGGKRHRRKVSRKNDYFAIDRFPSTSFFISEAHTQGSPFTHGVGILYRPLMDAGEERSFDQTTGLSGPAFYLTTAWNRNTGWGDLTILHKTLGYP